MKKIEDKVFEFINKHRIVIFFIIISGISLLVRFFLLKYESVDYTMFLKEWFDEIKQFGGLKALNREIGDYNTPYLTIIALLTYLPIKSLYSIKIVSIFFDYVLAFGVCKIVAMIIKNNNNKKDILLIIYGTILMLPTVMLNSACWGQADSIYTAFTIWSIAFFFFDKYVKSFILLGVAFAFKLQTIFILPLYILIYISKRKFSIVHFFIIPVMNFVMCIPAMLARKDYT